MSLTISQKNTALVTCFNQGTFTTNDVMTVLLRTSVPVDEVESAAVDLVMEWQEKSLIREMKPGVWVKKP